MKRPLLILAAFAALTSFAASAQPVTFHATMDAKSEVPPNDSAGKGTVTATFEPAAKLLTYTITYSDLTGPATASHLHGPAAPGQNAGVIVPFQPPLASPIKGQATLTDLQAAELMEGKVYANVHTAAHPGGEIRGQMTR